MAKKTVAGTPADPTVRYISVSLNGETYKLAYDFNNIAMVESLTGVNLFSAFSLSGINANQLRGLFYGCLLKAHPKMTMVDVSKLMTLPNMPAITQAIVDTWSASMPDQESVPNEETLDPEPATN
jgi:hypothetical protein